MMREALRELYGLEGNRCRAVLDFWGRVLTGDFGPSLSAFPTPVMRPSSPRLPWTVGLLVLSTLFAWVLGNLLGALAGYFRQQPPAEGRRRRRDGAAAGARPTSSASC